MEDVENWEDVGTYIMRMYMYNLRNFSHELHTLAVFCTLLFADGGSMTTELRQVGRVCKLRRYKEKNYKGIMRERRNEENKQSKRGKN